MTGAEPDRPPGKGAQGFVGGRGAVEAAPGLDAVIPVQKIGDLGVVVAREIHRDHRRPVLQTLQADKPGLSNDAETLQEQGSQFQLLFSYGPGAGLFYIGQGCMEAKDARQVQGAGFKFIGEIGGGSSCSDRLPVPPLIRGSRVRANSGLRRKPPVPWGPREALVARKGQGIGPYF